MPLSLEAEARQSQLRCLDQRMSLQPDLRPGLVPQFEPSVSLLMQRKYCPIAEGVDFLELKQKCPAGLFCS
ncbi:MAG: hypothetical protein PHG00_15250 [Methylococcales bacterium]|nr:hypothetical protein [Methylococcales bacterium]